MAPVKTLCQRRIKYGAKPVDYYKLSIKRRGPKPARYTEYDKPGLYLKKGQSWPAVEQDKFVATPGVVTLNKDNYGFFLREHEAVMVFYYEPDVPACETMKAEVAKAANTTEKPGHVYAAVNCTENEQICEYEYISSIPSFKMFSRGWQISEYDNSVKAEDLKRFVETAPLAERPQ